MTLCSGKSEASVFHSRIVDEPMTEALSRRYLAYALSTITGRALRFLNRISSWYR